MYSRAAASSQALLFTARVVVDTLQLLDNGVEAIVSGAYQTLTFLDVSNCRNITEDALGWLGGALGTQSGRACAGLLTLKAAHCERLRDKGLHWLGRGCRALRYIDLSNCSLVRECDEVTLRGGEVVSNRVVDVSTSFALCGPCAVYERWHRWTGQVQAATCPERCI